MISNINITSYHIIQTYHTTCSSTLRLPAEVQHQIAGGKEVNGTVPWETKHTSHQPDNNRLIHIGERGLVTFKNVVYNLAALKCLDHG